MVKAEDTDIYQDVQPDTAASDGLGPVLDETLESRLSRLGLQHYAERFLDEGLVELGDLEYMDRQPCCLKVSLASSGADRTFSSKHQTCL